MARVRKDGKGRMSDPQVAEAARQFAVLAEPARLLLLRALMDGESRVGELAEQTAIKQGTVSKHLAILAGAGFLERRREGTYVFYRIADPVVHQLCELMCRRVSDVARQRAEELAGR